VLRRVAALAEAGPLAWPDLGTRLSYPDWVIRRLGEDLGPERAMGALDQMNIAASQTIRADGYTQDPGSQAVAEHMTELMGANPGPVLDVCSAPGGKATLLVGLRNLSVVVADGTEPPFRAAQFAGVLVDAPCSGLGSLRRRPDARWRVRPDDVGRLAALQRRLLGSVAGLVAPGGVLVYSVCTLTRAETEDVSSWLARELGSGWEVLGPPGPPWEPHGQGAILLPQSVGTDGMYLSAYRRLAA
jgi:16S rRNA (cytosine967-C5)-methyltransferase